MECIWLKRKECPHFTKAKDVELLCIKEDSPLIHIPKGVDLVEVCGVCLQAAQMELRILGI